MAYIIIYTNCFRCKIAPAYIKSGNQYHDWQPPRKKGVVFTVGACADTLRDIGNFHKNTPVSLSISRV